MAGRNSRLGSLVLLQRTGPGAIRVSQSRTHSGGRSRRGQTREYAATYGNEPYLDYDELLARSDIDILHIAPPVPEIPACTIEAAEAGKHMVTGEPMAMTVAGPTRW